MFPQHPASHNPDLAQGCVSRIWQARDRRDILFVFDGIQREGDREGEVSWVAPRPCGALRSQTMDVPTRYLHAQVTACVVYGMINHHSLPNGRCCSSPDAALRTRLELLYPHVPSSSLAVLGMCTRAHVRVQVGTSTLGLQVMNVGIHTMVRSTVPIFVLLFSVGLGLQASYIHTLKCNNYDPSSNTFAGACAGAGAGSGRPSCVFHL